MKKLFIGIFSVFLSIYFSICLNAGSATNSGEGYNITATATSSYISCIVTGKLSNGSTAVVKGYKATPSGIVYQGDRSSSVKVYWYISEVPGAASWAYCFGSAKLSDGQWYHTTAAYA